MTIESKIWKIIFVCLLAAHLQTSLFALVVEWTEWRPCPQGEQIASYRFKPCEDISRPVHHRRRHGDGPACSGAVLEVASRACVPECETVVIQRLLEDNKRLQTTGGSTPEVETCFQEATQQVQEEERKSLAGRKEKKTHTKIKETNKNATALSKGHDELINTTITTNINTNVKKPYDGFIQEMQTLFFFTDNVHRSHRTKSKDATRNQNIFSTLRHGNLRDGTSFNGRDQTAASVGDQRDEGNEEGSHWGRSAPQRRTFHLKQQMGTRGDGREAENKNSFVPSSRMMSQPSSAGPEALDRHRYKENAALTGPSSPIAQESMTASNVNDIERPLADLLFEFKQRDSPPHSRSRIPASYEEGNFHHPPAFAPKFDHNRGRRAAVQSDEEPGFNTPGESVTPLRKDVRGIVDIVRGLKHTANHLLTTTYNMSFSKVEERAEEVVSKSLENVRKFLGMNGDDEHSGIVHPFIDKVKRFLEFIDHFSDRISISKPRHSSSPTKDDASLEGDTRVVNQTDNQAESRPEQTLQNVTLGSGRPRQVNFSDDVHAVPIVIPSRRRREDNGMHNIIDMMGNVDADIGVSTQESLSRKRTGLSDIFETAANRTHNQIIVFNESLNSFQGTIKELAETTNKTRKSFQRLFVLLHNASRERYQNSSSPPLLDKRLILKFRDIIGKMSNASFQLSSTQRYLQGMLSRVSSNYQSLFHVIKDVVSLDGNRTQEIDSKVQPINILHNFMESHKTDLETIMEMISSDFSDSDEERQIELIQQLWGEVKKDTKSLCTDTLTVGFLRTLWKASQLTLDDVQQWSNALNFTKTTSFPTLAFVLDPLLDILKHLFLHDKLVVPEPNEPALLEPRNVLDFVLRYLESEWNASAEELPESKRVRGMFRDMELKTREVNPLTVKGNRRFLLQLDSLFDPDSYEQKKREHRLLQFLLKIPRLLNASELEDYDLKVMQRVNDFDYLDYSFFDEASPPVDGSLVEHFLAVLDKLVGIDLRAWNDSFPQFVGESAKKTGYLTENFQEMYSSFAKGVRMMSRALRGILVALQNKTLTSDGNVVVPQVAQEFAYLNNFLDDIANISRQDAGSDFPLLNKVSYWSKKVAENSSFGDMNDTIELIDSLFRQPVSSRNESWRLWSTSHDNGQEDATTFPTETPTSHPEDMIQQWSEWTPWSMCTASCGLGEQTRSRKCSIKIEGLLLASDQCPGHADDAMACQWDVCNVFWSDWSAWTRCDNRCGVGNRTRARSCRSNSTAIIAQDHHCDGESEERKTCTEYDFDECSLHKIFVPGYWTDWSPWTPCSENCTGHRTRHRACHPHNVTMTSSVTRVQRDQGLFCAGDAEQNVSCSIFRHGRRCENATIQGIWTEWSTWTVCSINRTGYRTRHRSCQLHNVSLTSSIATMFPDANISCSGVSQQNISCSALYQDLPHAHARHKSDVSGAIIISLTSVGFVLFVIAFIWYCSATNRKKRGRPYKTRKGNGAHALFQGEIPATRKPSWTSPKSMFSRQSGSRDSDMFPDRAPEETARLLQEDPISPGSIPQHCPYTSQPRASVEGGSGEWLWPWETEGDDWVGLDHAASAARSELDGQEEMNELRPTRSLHDGESNRIRESLEKSAEAWFS